MIDLCVHSGRPRDVDIPLSTVGGLSDAGRNHRHLLGRLRFNETLAGFMQPEVVPFRPRWTYSERLRHRNAARIKSVWSRKFHTAYPHHTFHLTGSRWLESRKSKVLFELYDMKWLKIK